MARQTKKKAGEKAVQVSGLARRAVKKGKEKLTFDLQVGFASEIITLADDTSVAATVAGLGVLDDQCEQVLIHKHREFFAFVTFLWK